MQRGVRVCLCVIRSKWRLAAGASITDCSSPGRGLPAIRLPFGDGQSEQREMKALIWNENRKCLLLQRRVYSATWLPR